MRISTQQMQTLSVNAMLDRQAQISKTQLQLSTGKRIVSPADDPSGAASVLGLSQSLQLNQQFQSNSNAAQARLNVEDGTLTNAVSLLQRARELAVQGNNGTESADSRKAIATEVNQLLDSMKNLANTQDANGEYIFAGYQSKQTPFSETGNGTFTYAGDQGQRSLQIGPTRYITTGDSGASVFMNIPGTTSNTFGILKKMVTDLNANTPSPSTITEIDAAMKNILTIQASVGARLNAIDLQKSVNDTNILQIQQTKSQIEDLDYASAVTSLNQQMTGLNAAQQTYVKVQGLSLFNYLR